MAVWCAVMMVLRNRQDFCLTQSKLSFPPLREAQRSPQYATNEAGEKNIRSIPSSGLGVGTNPVVDSIGPWCTVPPPRPPPSPDLHRGSLQLSHHPFVLVFTRAHSPKIDDDMTSLQQPGVTPAGSPTAQPSTPRQCQTTNKLRDLDFPDLS